MNKTTNEFSPEVRARAVRLVLDHEEHPSRWAAVVSVSSKIGGTAQTLTARHECARSLKAWKERQ